jgi:SAM-dependent methyltransferase
VAFSHDGVLGNVGRYYSGKLREHGDSPRGVDWNSEESQQLRFEQLLRVIDPDDEHPSVLDYGCGYGALIGALTERLGDGGFTYVGHDIAPDMLEAARLRVSEGAECRFIGDADALAPADYVVASGIFNVKLDTLEDLWAEYVDATIERLDALSTRGFAFNMLTSYGDAEKRRPDLFYGDPCAYFDMCKRRYSRFVTLAHDYPLWEVTLIVRKEAGA